MKRRTILATMLATPLAAPALAQPAKIKIVVFNSISDGALFVALEKGWFRAEGLEVEIAQLDTGAAIHAALASEAVDAAGDSPAVALYNAARQRIGFKVVADKGSTPPGHGYQAIMVRSDLAESVKTAADLRGKRFGLTGWMNGVANEAMMNKLLTANGIAEREINFVNLSYPDVLAGLGTKAIDAGILIEPLAARAEELGTAKIWKRADEVYANQQYGVLVYGPGLLKRGAAPDAFMRAYLKGARFYNDALDGKSPRAGLVEVLTKYTAVKNPAAYERMRFPGIDPNGNVNVAGLAQDMAYYVASGRQRQAIDMSLIIDQGYAQRAVGQLGRYG